jgi:cysteine desulfuration protein SufE
VTEILEYFASVHGEGFAETERKWQCCKAVEGSGLAGKNAAPAFSGGLKRGIALGVEPMSSPAAQKQAELLSRFSVIEDLQERLAAVVSRAKKLPALAETEREERYRVQGCTSRVWLIGEVRDGACFFRIDADSSLVKGLAALVCEIYQGAPAADVATHEPTLLEDLRLADQLSPTRRHGLAQVRRAIREFALSAAGS